MAQLSIATPLEPPLVQHIAAELSDYDIWYEPDLLPPPRYPSDHRGDPTFRRSPEQQRHWSAMLAATAVSFGIPGDTPQGLRQLVDAAPGLRLVQATAAGAGQQIAAAGLSEHDLQRSAVASSSGVHAGPLAEFALLGVLAFTRDLARLERDRAARRWDHYATPDLDGRTMVILGVGAIGSRIARLATALGMRVLGVNTTGSAPSAVLDVTAEEPLPPDSPLWRLPNVILSPHTAALSPRENE